MVHQLDLTAPFLESLESVDCAEAINNGLICLFNPMSHFQIQPGGMSSAGWDRME